MDHMTCKCGNVLFRVVKTFDQPPMAWRVDREYRQCAKCGRLYDENGSYVACTLSELAERICPDV